MTESTKLPTRKLVRKEVLGIPVDILDNALQSMIELHSKGGGQIVTLNVETLMAAKKDKVLTDAIKAAEIIIPESIGIAWALRLHDIYISPEPGISISRKLLSYAELKGWQVALIGGTPEVLTKLKQKFKEELPGLNINIARHGYHNEEAWGTIKEELITKTPDLVLLALGIPMQEVWANQVRLNISGSQGLWIGVGGSFDIWSGTKKRAPLIFRRLNLEWLYRLITNPRRWRRAFALPAFAFEILSRQENL